ncbi:hypothetical protein HSBAA_61410 [Vreelandella sulfidaeris]|uniref:Alcohol dehydrogenase-like C-terminal domain-containing protein n=1 Tax=Vreelandella sulfidaeris TaxID=115553 RepID=A0A455UFF6_9GAMM|nr:hypothetical protein HSBAA_61410 [Halomonas sulfidaeris]
MDDGSHRLQRDDEALATFFGQSSFASHAVVSARNAVKVDPEVELALLGPLGCGIQTGAGTVLNRLKPEFGSSIVVYGCGAVGLSAVMAAKIIGCQRIIAVDINDDRLALARELGATHTVNGKQEETVDRVHEITGGGSEYAVETTGAPPCGTSIAAGVTPPGCLGNCRCYPGGHAGCAPRLDG